MRLFALITICCTPIMGSAQVPPQSICEQGSCAPVVRADRTPGNGASSGGAELLAQWNITGQSIVRVVNARGGSQALGSGTLIEVEGAGAGSRGVVITCAHLFREGVGQVSVIFAGHTPANATLLKLDTEADLAGLAIDAPRTQPAALANDVPRPGDLLLSCGYDSDGRLAVNRGRALGYVTVQGSHGCETLELSGSARLGDSGGPVFDRQGRLAGVLFGTDGTVVDATYCGRVRRFLADVLKEIRRRPQDDLATGPLVNSPPRPVNPPAPPKVELPAGLDPIAGAAERLERAAEPWLAAKVTALLVSFGMPGGVAAVAGGALVWVVMRRGKKKLRVELDRLRGGSTAIASHAAMNESAASAAIVERHHNRYVPYAVDALDKAWAAAHARVGERYPGAVPYLKIVEGVKDQLLSGKDEAQLS